MEDDDAYLLKRFKSEIAARKAEYKSKFGTLEPFFKYNIDTFDNPLYWMNLFSRLFHHDLDHILLPLWRVAFRRHFGEEEFARWEGTGPQNMNMEKVELLMSLGRRDPRFLWKRATEYMLKRFARQLHVVGKSFFFLDLYTYGYLNNEQQLILSDGRVVEVPKGVEKVMKVTKDTVLIRYEDKCETLNLKTRDIRHVFNLKLFNNIIVSPSGRYIVGSKLKQGLYVYDMTEQFMNIIRTEKVVWIPLFFKTETEFYDEGPTAIYLVNVLTGTMTTEFDTTNDNYSVIKSNTDIAIYDTQHNTLNGRLV
jgi:hypothetical protein